jgi:hypothetical protein
MAIARAAIVTIREHGNSLTTSRAVASAAWSRTPWGEPENADQLSSSTFVGVSLW